MAALASGTMSPDPVREETDTPDASYPTDPRDYYDLVSEHSRRDSVYSTATTTTSPNPNANHVRESLSRSRAPSLASTTSSVVKRKPLPVTASPLATRFSIPELPQRQEQEQDFHPSHHPRPSLPSPPLPTTTEELEELEEPSFRPFSLDSPTLHEFPNTVVRPFSTDSLAGLSENQRLSQRGPPVPFKQLPHQPAATTPLQRSVSYAPTESSTSSAHTQHASVTSITPSSDSHQTYSPSQAEPSTATTMSVFSSPKVASPLNLRNSNATLRTTYNDSNDPNLLLDKPLPKSPGSKLGSFFGWGGNTSPASSTTTFSDRAYSPVTPHPGQSSPFGDAFRPGSSRGKPPAIDVPKANADGYFGSAYLHPQATPTAASSASLVDEMEEELKAITTELATSIRREIDLEDLVERLRSEVSNPSPPGRRTSDYFSDSGYSSVNKYSEYDDRQEEIDRAQRKAEQEKAQLRLELTTKVQDERSKRKQLESQIRYLEEKASQVDISSINTLDANERLKDLEATCEDLRRRLNEERQVKENFEDLLTALKGELENSHNERDNLRDEVVPQLKARVEGLEAQAAEQEKLAYEHTKTQQELQMLKQENVNLINAQQQMQAKRFDSIAEEVGAPKAIPARFSMGLSRSNSVAAVSRGTASIPNSRPVSLSRSSSVKVTAFESREALAERVKDIEAQRDALHRALKSLLERQEHQNRENQKKIRQLETERDRALSSQPTRLGYNKEVASLREEINTLRRRADDAIEQKWQCEKGLAGLKMDLDRAEQEISSLKALLEERDIAIPPGARDSIRSVAEEQATSESLERAYKELQNSYAESLERIRKLELPADIDDNTTRAVQELEQSLADAIAERDYARDEADALRQHSESMRQAEQSHMQSEMAMADELRDSARRVEELAAQVRQQLALNSTLRQRLAETIDRGEKDQKANAQRITFMQGKLKSLEDKLMAAQQASEERIARHEEDVRSLKENHNQQLQRVKDGLRSPRVFAPKSPMSPMFANTTKSPRLQSTSSGKAMTVSEDSKMEFLKQRVVDLETALATADKEMEEVIGKMNVAQIEVMELQNEREEAMRETRRLQKLVDQERMKSFEERFASLSS
ncbi:hypothetical protein F5884DRAFT_242103 [Xylogone sp. PMI_703]|nr:hypothetical protein F5884DRAFT_242103 [Xylogone sp. PMI_703]